MEGSRFQRIFPEPCFYEPKRQIEEFRKDIEAYYDKLSYPLDAIAEKIMKYNNTRLQYLLKLYYKQQPKSTQDHNVYFVYKSASKTYKYGNIWPPLAFLYKTLWTDIKDFFTVFYLDFIKT
jgi:hypothetical protein